MIELTLVRGGGARLVRMDGERGHLSSEVPSAPGSRIEGQLQSGRTIKLKVHRCVKNGERFDIEGRFIDLTREMRLSLEEQLSAEPGGGIQ